MLAELTIINFAIIDRLRLVFSPGFNVFTGETGAGKSIIIDAVSLLLGGRADSRVVRSETDMASIEGIFYLSPRERAVLEPLLEQESLQNEEDQGVLILAREIRLNGHNVCRINGRAVRLSVLAQFGNELVDIHGQSEHLSLLREPSHLDFLDRYGGLEAERRAFGARVRALRAIRRELDELILNERQMRRRADLLRYQVQEIQEARLQPQEDQTLEQELNRLANAEKLTELGDEALALISEGREEREAASDLLGQALRLLSSLARLDPQMETCWQQAEALSVQLEELAATLRDYAEVVEFNPARLERVEERLALIRRLQRKYGDGIEDILAFARQAAQDLDQIEHSGERIAELQDQEKALLREIGELGMALSLRRREAGAHLSAAVEAELGYLRMEQARFAVHVRWEKKDDGAMVEHVQDGIDCAPGRYAFRESGLDRVAFLIAPNVGEPLKPMAKVASGGETSRLMLSLKTALSKADHIPTLIFDEIDQGIGGRIGGMVGEKLWHLAQVDGGAHQVFCVTHLPQLAGYGDRHLHVYKSVVQGRTTTAVDVLEGDARVVELAQMLGGDAQGTRQIARELLQHD